jgi:hypothetical protein
MKLLFDENLSPQLVRLLDDLFPDSVHVRDVGLKAADPVVWKYAQDNFLMICSKDSTCTDAAFCWDILRKLCGYDWAIVQPRTLHSWCENTSRRLKRLPLTTMRPFLLCRNAQPNQLLDRSGGGVFLKMFGPAKI